MKNTFAYWEVTALLVAVTIPYIFVFSNGLTTGGVNSTSNGIDLETLSLFGVTPEFAEQFRLNLLKAIELEEKGERDQLRQEFGGVSGGFYQGGNAGAGGAGSAVGGGNQEEDGDEEDDEDAGPTTPGPGAFGVLSGLFGIFSGLGTLNPSRIIQSTVNFFPPGQRMMAQMIVDSLIGYVPPENRTTRPRPSGPRPTPTSLPINEGVMTMTDGNSTIVEAKTNETTVISKDAENNNMDTFSPAATSGAMGPAAGKGEGMPMSELVDDVTNPPSTTQGGPVSIHKLLSEAEVTTPPIAVHEDDEVDIEKRLTTTLKPANSSKTEYKVKVKVTATNVV